MSLFGKILAVLNIVGAIAFVAIASMDYAKREAWAYANYVHDVALAGLPVDDKQVDDRESPLKYKLAEETKKEWFGNASISTQVEEVDRVKKEVDGLLDKVKDDPAKQTAELARILTPFAQHYTEREWLLSVRADLATPDAEAKLHQRLHDAFTKAVTACLEQGQLLDVKKPDEWAFPLKFPQAFADACRDQGLEPDPAFEQTFLKLLPAKPENTFDNALAEAQKAAGQDAHAKAEKFLQTLRNDPAATVRKDGDASADTLDKVYQATLTDIHDQLKAQLDNLDPLKNTDRLSGHQRSDIARYLFNMVEALDPDAAQKGVVASPSYDRFIRVVGAATAAQEVSDQAALLGTLGDELQTERDKERGEFAIAHQMLIMELQNRAVRLHNAGRLLDDTTTLLNNQETTTANQQKKVDALEKDLANARDKTKQAMKTLRDTSESLHKQRIDGRDLLGENLELEKQIRDLENKR